MKNRKRIKLVTFVLVFGLNLTMALGQYSVGQTISQSTRDKTVLMCANGSGSSTLGNLLSPAQGEPTRVVWLNFFESW